MHKPADARGVTRAYIESFELIDQSRVLISGSGAALAVHRDQIAKAKAMIESSRRQIARLRAK
jgi:hypothetical protein